MSDSMSGAFLCSGFSARQSTATHAFCKPANIRIYSAPPPVRHRVVTYQMKFVEGSEQPKSAAEWADAKDYQSPYNGERSFSYMTGTLQIDLNELMNQIRRHFYTKVLKSLDTVNRATAFSRLMRENTTTRRYTIDDNTLIQVSQVHHLRHVDIDTDGVHVDQRAVLRYQGEITDNQGNLLNTLDYQGKYIGCVHNYESGRQLLTGAVNHFKQAEVREEIIASLGQPESM